MAFSYRLRTDKDVEFTGEIVQNAMESENIALPGTLDGINGTARCRIKAVTIISDENLQWELWFWANDLFQESNLDADRFVGKILFAAADGTRIAATGAYYYYQEDLDIAYEDLDKTGELHVSLINRSAAAKTAGAGGEIVVEFIMEPMVTP